MVESKPEPILSEEHNTRIVGDSQNADSSADLFLHSFASYEVQIIVAEPEEDKQEFYDQEARIAERRIQREDLL